MKPKIIVFGLLLFINYSSYTQIIKGIGIKSGISFSNQTYEDTRLSNNYLFNSNPGLYEAITFDIVKSDIWDISLDLGFYQSVNKNEYNIYSVFAMEDIGNYTFNYGILNLSPMLRLKIPVGKFSAFVQFGPRIDYYSPSLSNKTVNNFLFDESKLMYGISIGEGLSYQLNNFSLFAEYQFLYCFNYLVDKSAYFPIAYNDNDRDRLKINTHTISFGIKYNIESKTEL